MSYPSSSLEHWFSSVFDLWLDMSKKKEEYDNYGWCECGIFHAILKEPNIIRRHNLASSIFWSVWIDQVIYTITRGKDESIYEKFRSKYPFPKVHSHSSNGYTTPYFILEFNLGDSDFYPPDIDLLLEYKEEFWNEIADYFKSIDKKELVEKAILEFKNDLAERGFPEKYHKLWDE